MFNSNLKLKSNFTPHVPKNLNCSVKYGNHTHNYLSKCPLRINYLWICLGRADKDGEQNKITFTLLQSEYNILNLNTMFMTQWYWCLGILHLVVFSTPKTPINSWLCFYKQANAVVDSAQIYSSIEENSNVSRDGCTLGIS